MTVAVILPSAVVFSPQGLQATTVMRWMSQSLAARGLLWAGWLALVAPVARLAFTAPGTRTLRSLPVDERAFVSGLLGLTMLLQGPWVLLFLRGQGAVAALGASLVASAIAASLAAGVGWRPAAVVVGATALAMLPAAPWAQVLLGGPLALLGTRSGWRFAPERGQRSWHVLRRTRPVLALVVAHALHLARTEGVRLSRALGLVVLGAATLVLASRNSPALTASEGLEQRLLCGVLPAVVVAGSLSGPLLQSEQRLRWVTLTTGGTERGSRLVALLSDGLFTAAAGAVFGLLAALGQREFPAKEVLAGALPPWPSPLRVVAEASVWSFAIGCAAHALVAREAARRRPDASRRVMSLVGLAVAGFVAASLGAQASLLLGASLTVLAIGAGMRSEA